MQAVAWAKALLRDTVAGIHAQWPKAAPQQHIDDLAQTITGTADQVYKDSQNQSLHSGQASAN